MKENVGAIDEEVVFDREIVESESYIFGIGDGLNDIMMEDKGLLDLDTEGVGTLYLFFSRASLNVLCRFFLCEIDTMDFTMQSVGCSAKGLFSMIKDTANNTLRYVNITMENINE